MSRQIVLSDFSQLKKSLFTAAPHKEEPKQTPPPPPASGLSREEEEVLAYFSRPSQPTKAVSGRKAQRTPTPAAQPSPPQPPVADFAAERNALQKQLDDAQRTSAKLATELAAVRKELARLQGECGRLRGELNKVQAAQPAPSSDPQPASSPVPQPVPQRAAAAVLDVPPTLAEAFPGELREMLLAVLADACAASRQCSRDRRAAVLEAILAANRSTGELERRREELKQIMKDSGGYTDPRKLSALGFRLVSGKTHWKVDYAGIRMPLAKTPSDYRSNVNAALDMANRCF